MNLEELKELMREFDASGIHKLSLQIGDTALKLEKEGSPKEVMLTPSPAVLPGIPPAVPTPLPASEPQPEDPDACPIGTPVKSPVVGTFYRASSPEAAPYVQVGQMVKKGQTLCIVEAMKMMNEITAPVSGEILRILVDNAAMVEYDQTIMLIKDN